MTLIGLGLVAGIVLEHDDDDTADSVSVKLDDGEGNDVLSVGGGKDIFIVATEPKAKTCLSTVMMLHFRNQR